MSKERVRNGDFSIRTARHPYGTYGHICWKDEKIFDLPPRLTGLKKIYADFMALELNDLSEKLNVFNQTRDKDEAIDVYMAIEKNFGKLGRN